MRILAGVLTTIWSVVSGLLNWLWATLRVMSHNRGGLAGLVVVALIVLVSYAGPLVVPASTDDVSQIYESPSLRHPLGTDSAGSDVLLQTINGGKGILTIGFLAAIISTSIALVFGSLAAFVGGKVDSALTWIADVALTIPQLPLLAVLAGIIHLSGQAPVAAVIGILAWPTLMRAIRAQVLSLKERDYVESARALGLGVPHILFREIAPNMAGYIAISFMLAVTAAMYASVGLTLLGLVPLANQNWGVMINFAWVGGSIFYKGSLWSILSPIIAIALFQLGLVTMSRSISEVFDPRLRGGG
jgi:peptide/nickel transport system permease protein